MTTSSNAGAVVIDANVVIAICAHEQDKFDIKTKCEVEI